MYALMSERESERREVVIEKRKNESLRPLVTVQE